MLNINELNKLLKTNLITKRIDKKEFINDLKAIPTNYVEIQISKDSNQIIIRQPNNNKFICHIARN
jgi:hypothetical protein